MSKTVLASLCAAAMFASVMPASAWVAGHSAGVWRGPAGGVHAYSDSFAAGGGGVRYGYAPRYYGGYSAGAVAGAAVAGAAVGAAIGATIASLPPACVPAGALYVCGGVYYRAYYGPSGVVYQVVPGP